MGTGQILSGGVIVRYKYMVLIFLGLLVFSSSAMAEVTIVEGIGYYYMEPTEVLATAEAKAKEQAVRDVLQKTEVALIGKTDSKDSILTRDEVIAIAAGIIKVKAVTYDLRPAEKDTIEIKATVRAEVDTDEVSAALKEERKRRGK